MYGSVEGIGSFEPPPPPKRRCKPRGLVLLSVLTLGLTAFASLEMLSTDFSALSERLSATAPSEDVNVEAVYTDELHMHSEEYKKYLESIAFQPAKLYKHTDFNVEDLNCLDTKDKEDDHPADACIKAYKCCTGPKQQCNPTFTPNYGEECRSCVDGQSERYNWYANANVGKHFALACWTGVIDECRDVCPRFTGLGDPAHDYCLDCLVTKAVGVTDWGTKRHEGNAQVRADDEFTA